MTPEQFRDAITKGLGRVLQHLRTHPSEPYRDIIREACLHDLNCDMQSEGSRGDYLFEIMNLSGMYDALASEVVQVLRTTQDTHEIWQAYDLVRHIAQTGNADARAAMYERFPGVDCNDVGAREIIAIDGLEGLLEVMRRLGRKVLAGEETRLDPYLLHMGQERLGADLRERVLEPLARTDPEIAACLEGIDRDERAAEEGRRDRKDFSAMTYEQVKQELEAANGRLGMRLGDWTRRAPEADVRRLCEDLAKETRPDYLLTYLRAFFSRAFPLDPAPLFTIANGEDDKLAHAALYALSAIETPVVRAFALSLLDQRRQLTNAFRLFRRNYEPGDHTLFMRVLSAGSFDVETLHEIGYDLREVFHEQDTPECRDPLLWVYENTPCSVCRFWAVKSLLKTGVLPEDVRCECLDDCDPDTRKLARGAQP